MKTSKNLYVYLLLSFLFALTYAITRYNIFGNVPWEDIPLYVVNKAISFTVVLMLLSSITNKKKFKPIMELFWKTIFILTLAHVLVSFGLLGPEYYKKFYSADELNLTGYFTLFFGISAFIGIIILNCKKFFPKLDDYLSFSESFNKILRRLIPILIVLHLFSMGVKGWLVPNKWHGYLFPISLLAFVGMVLYILKVKINQYKK